jgi:hypothetical protein
MLVFIDTEFTDFINIDLISIGMVSDQGHVFYAERTDFCMDDCNDHVRYGVLPLLGVIPNSQCTFPELTERLRNWFESLPESATVIYDYLGDWMLLADALAGEKYEHPPNNLVDKKLISADVLTNPIFIQAHTATYSAAKPRHHALADAQALAEGYSAWIRGG